MQSPDALIGKTVGGRFLVHRRLAAGGMGVVYRAEQVPLGRAVALKVLRPPADSSQYEAYCRRFLLEAAAVANLNHPHTIVIHDYGREEDLLYFAMEYVEGQTLEKLVQVEGPLHPEDCIYIGLQVCSSLGAAHQQSLVHRDLKPSNVMLTNQPGDPLYVKVLDFGLVKIVSNDPKMKLTQEGVMLGSPRYMSPEQVSGAALDHRADIYSFGALMFFMLTGKPPFYGGSQFDAMRSHLHTPPPMLRSVFERCSASPDLESVIQRCLAKEPSNRYTHMAELASALKKCRKSKGNTYSPKSHLTSVSIAPPAPPPSDTQVTTAQPPAPQEQAPQQHAPQHHQASQGFHINRSWIIGAGIMLAVGGLGGIGLALIESNSDPASVPAAALPPTMPQAPVPAPQPNTQPMGSGEDETTMEVRIVSDPPRARVTRGGADLGDAPITLRIPASETWELELSARGYQSRTVSVTTDTPTLTVSLEPTRGARMAPRPRPRNTGMSQSMTTDTPPIPVRDPWAASM